MFFCQKFWADIPAPLLTKVYLFNVSNPKEVSSTGAKPILKEVGPFVFDEYHKKVKIQWNENNDTVTYQQIRPYFLDKVTILMVLFLCKKPWLKFFILIRYSMSFCRFNPQRPWTNQLPSSMLQELFSGLL